MYKNQSNRYCKKLRFFRWLNLIQNTHHQLEFINVKQQECIRFHDLHNGLSNAIVRSNIIIESSTTHQHLIAWTLAATHVRNL